MRGNNARKEKEDSIINIILYNTNELVEQRIEEEGKEFVKILAFTPLNSDFTKQFEGANWTIIYEGNSVFSRAIEIYNELYDRYDKSENETSHMNEIKANIHSLIDLLSEDDVDFASKNNIQKIVEGLEDYELKDGLLCKLVEQDLYSQTKIDVPESSFARF